MRQDMLDKADSFFGKKQKLKLTAKGKTVGDRGRLQPFPTG